MSAKNTRIAVLVITDGRDDYLQRTVRSAMANLTGPVTEWWMYDDTGDLAYREGLGRRYPTFVHINGGARQGFGGAIRDAWGHLADWSTVDYVFHLEADFVFNRPVDLGALASVLTDRTYLAQMALVRQSWHAEERAAGGLLERALRQRRERRHMTSEQLRIELELAGGDEAASCAAVTLLT